MNQENTLQTPWTEEMLPQEPVAEELAPYAGFWRRCGAFVLDVFISSLAPVLICFPIMFFITKQSLLAEQAGADISGYSVAMVITYLVWNLLGMLSFWLYFSLQESGRHQATLGKRIFKIKVVSKTGSPITFAHATGRTFAKVLSYATFYVGFLMMPFSNRKRALHDFIAETYVVKANFQRGDMLSNTPARWGKFAILLSVLFALSLAMTIYLQRQTADSTALKARMALFMLPVIAQQGNIPAPLTQNGVTYLQDETGYRALFQDEMGDDYVLYLSDENSAVCCDVFPYADCQNIAVPVCQ